MNNNNQDLPRLSEVNPQGQPQNYQAPPTQANNANMYTSTNANMYVNPQQNNNNPYAKPYSNPESNPNIDGERERDIEKGVDQTYNLLGDGVNVDDMMRLGFIRKVYGILSFQLTITVAFAGLTFFDPVRDFLLNNIWLFWTCLGLSLFTIIPIICCRDVSRRVPINYILLTVWTVCESVMVATCCSVYDKEVVITAGVLTAAVTIALTIYACTTKTDFTFLGGMLFVGICLLLFFGIFSFAFGRVLHTFYCVLGVFVYSIYLIYDTQLVMGKFGNEYQIDDYIIAAIMIYIDIIQIFLYLLQIFGRK